LKFKSRSIILLLLCVLCEQAIAHGPRYTHLATSAQIAEDRNNGWKAEDIANGRYSELFVNIDDENPNLNFTSSTYWVKFNITNGTQDEHEYYLETARALTNKICLYEVRDKTTQTLFVTGDDYPFDSRPIVYRKFAFPIVLAPDETKQFLIEVKSDGEVINLPLKLWKPENFNSFVQRENLTLGSYYGLLMLVVSLFLFFAFVVKDKIYAYYVAYVAFLFFMQASLDGLTFEYLWPESPWMANHSILFFSSASVFTLMLYAAEYLTLNQMPKWFITLYKFLLGLVAICIITSLTKGIAYELTFPVINGLTLFSILIIIAAIGWRNKTNQKVSIFFTLGFLAVLLGGIVFILTNFNILKSDFLSHNAIKLGSAIEVIFLSLAMVSRYRDIQREKNEAKQEAFESLEKLNALTREQNINLEKQVAERTEELQEKNKEIIDSITYAKRIQDAILPPEHLVQVHLSQAMILYMPKDIVAGDFYWLEPLNKGVLIAAADCTGHGVPGAMVSVVCHNALNRSVREFGRSKPSEILDRTALIVDETFEKSKEEIKDGMDISLSHINYETREVQWAGANNPLWIITKNELSQLGEPSHIEGELRLYDIRGDKQPIGKYPNRKSYTNHHIQLAEGDTVYMFTDGFPDQFGGERGKKYKSKNFKTFLVSIQDTSIQEQRSILGKEFTTWRGHHEQIDDVCVIGVRF
jgi:two-component system, sensor histidine kinase LadS